MTKIIASSEYNNIIAQGVKSLLQELSVENLTDEERKKILKKYEWLDRLFGFR